jgi:hypothetical protein
VSREPGDEDVAVLEEALEEDTVPGFLHFEVLCGYLGHIGDPMQHMATLQDVDELALELPHVEKKLDDGRPSYRAHGKLFILHRSRRPDAVDPETGERMDDVLMFRVSDLDVKDMILADERGIYFTTPHFKGYPAVLLRIPDLGKLDREELRELVVEAWLTRAQKRVAKAWLAEHSEDE